jgi:hypothetical protein
MSLADALSGRLQDWTGLPAGIGERELASAHGCPWVWRDGWQERGAGRYRVLDAGDASAWFAGDDEQATWVEVQLPPAADVATTLATLGPAPRERASRIPAAGATTAEHVWPARGLAVVVASPIEAGRQPWVQQLGLFTPMSFEDYLVSVGLWGRLRPSPL